MSERSRPDRARETTRRFLIFGLRFRSRRDRVRRCRGAYRQPGGHRIGVHRDDHGQRRAIFIFRVQSRGGGVVGACPLHFPIAVFSLSKTPGSRGLKPPAPRCLFHCRIAHCRLSIFHFRAYRRKVSVAVVAVVTVVTVVTVVARWV